MEKITISPRRTKNILTYGLLSSLTYITQTSLLYLKFLAQHKSLGLEVPHAYVFRTTH